MGGECTATPTHPRAPATRLPAIRPRQGKKGGVAEAGAPKAESDVLRIVRMVAQRGFDPCIVFNFSKKECEQLCKQVRAQRASAPWVEARRWA